MVLREITRELRRLETALAVCFGLAISGCSDAAPVKPPRLPTNAPATFRIWTPMIDEEIANRGVEIPSGASAGLIVILNSEPGVEDGTSRKKAAPDCGVHVGLHDYEWHGSYLLKWAPGNRMLVWRSPALETLFERIENAANEAAGSAATDRREASLAPENELGLRKRIEPITVDPAVREQRAERLRIAIVEALNALPDTHSATTTPSR